MMKTFFCHGFESGSRLSTAARGKESKKEVISLSSSTDAPVAFTRGSNAVEVSEVSEVSQEEGGAIGL
jgi:hypothetical protein